MKIEVYDSQRRNSYNKSNIDSGVHYKSCMQCPHYMACIQNASNYSEILPPKKCFWRSYFTSRTLMVVLDHLPGLDQNCAHPTLQYHLLERLSNALREEDHPYYHYHREEPITSLEAKRQAKKHVGDIVLSWENKGVSLDNLPKEIIKNPDTFLDKCSANDKLKDMALRIKRDAELSELCEEFNDAIPSHPYYYSDDPKVYHQNDLQRKIKRSPKTFGTFTAKELAKIETDYVHTQLLRDELEVEYRERVLAILRRKAGRKGLFYDEKIEKFDFERSIITSDY